MTSDLATILSSDIIQIFAQDETRFFVHKHVLTSQSKPFHDALTGEWKESSDQAIHLQDWDTSTVIRMLEYLYRGSYQYPNPTEILSETMSASVATSPAATPFDKYAEALLAHAKVYHLAHYKAINLLKAMALEHLDRALQNIDPVAVSDPLGQIVHFARYVYENTDHLNNHEEPLRILVANFLARNFKTLQSIPEMVQLLSEGGDIVMDVIVEVAKSTAVPRPPCRLNPVSNYPARYVSKLMVLSSDSLRAEPHDHLRELNGASCDLNWGCDAEIGYTWIYPVYCRIAREACTGITLDDNNRYPSWSTSVIGPGRFVFHDRNSEGKKITAVALLRQDDYLADVSCIPAEHGTYDGMTADLNQGRPGGYLYIVWKSVHV